MIPHILAVAAVAAAAAEMFVAQSSVSHRLDLLLLCTIYLTVCPCLAVSVGYSRMLAVVLELMVVYFVLLADLSTPRALFSVAQFSLLQFGVELNPLAVEAADAVFVAAVFAVAVVDFGLMLLAKAYLLERILLREPAVLTVPVYISAD